LAKSLIHPQCLIEGVEKESHCMAKKFAWFSDESDVYHNDSDCNTGNNIEREYMTSGTGGNRLCRECKRLH